MKGKIELNSEYIKSPRKAIRKSILNRFKEKAKELKVDWLTLRKMETKATKNQPELYINPKYALTTDPYFYWKRPKSKLRKRVEKIAKSLPYIIGSVFLMMDLYEKLKD